MRLNFLKKVIVLADKFSPKQAGIMLDYLFKCIISRFKLLTVLYNLILRYAAILYCNYSLHWEQRQ